MEVKVLGSVSPYCKGNKNCPGYLIKTEETKILLDCGNGITRLMNMNTDLEGLNIIISHLHRDHYADILSLAYATFVYHNLNLLKNRVKLYIPKSNGLGRPNPLIDDTFLHCLGEQHYFDIIDYDTDDVLTIGDTKVTFASNIHDVLSNSIKVEDKESTLVYSGDTGYIGNSLEQFAKNSTLFICESTFLKGQKGIIDHHLCAFEAASIAYIAKPQTLMLTHFWPEIDKNEYVKEATPIFLNTIVAEEGKILKLKRND